MHPALSILISILISLISLGAIILASSWAHQSGKLCAESARKAVHIGMGLICLSFPWLFSSVLAVQALAAVAVISLLVVRLTKLRKSVGSSLFSVKRLSIGELLFPVAVAWLFTLSWDNPMLYCISLLLLTLADSAGALAGSKLGCKIYQTAGASKSLEGSMAFFITAFFCIALPLHYFASLPFDCIAYFHGIPLTHIILLSLTVALFSTAVEGAAGHGTDNLLIPVGAFLLLDYYITLSGNELLLRSAALMIILAVLLATHRKHTLNGGAILSALLYSFAAFTLGGLPCLMATIILFVRHMAVQNRLPAEQVAIHSIDAILSISVPSLMWLTLGRQKIISYPDAQFGFICTLAIIVYLLNTGTQKHLHRNKPSMCMGFILSLLILSSALMIDIPLRCFLPPLLLAPILAWGFFYWKDNASSSAMVNWLKLGLLALFGSASSMLIILS